MNLFKTHKGFDSTLRYSVLLFCVLLIGYSFVVLWIPFAVFPRKYRREVEEAANEFAVDPSLLYAVMKTESNFRTNAVSQRGAVGLMQLLPETFSEISARLGENAGESDFFQPATNIRYGAFYLSFLLSVFNDDEKAVLAAYNAGPGKVSEWIADEENLSAEGKINMFPYAETEKYVMKTVYAKGEYQRLYRIP